METVYVDIETWEWLNELLDREPQELPKLKALIEEFS